MPWVPKNPRPSYFCGCPPCPLCFDHVVDDGVRRVIVQGLKKFVSDMLGGRVPTKTEMETLKKAADNIHVANLAKNEERKDAGEAFHFEDDKQFLERRINAMAKDKVREDTRPKMDPRPVLDKLEIDDKGNVVSKEKAAEKAKTNKVPVVEAAKVPEGLDANIVERTLKLISRQLGIPESALRKEMGLPPPKGEIKTTFGWVGPNFVTKSFEGYRLEREAMSQRYRREIEERGRRRFEEVMAFDPGDEAGDTMLLDMKVEGRSFTVSNSFTSRTPRPVYIPVRTPFSTVVDPKQRSDPVVAKTRTYFVSEGVAVDEIAMVNKALKEIGDPLGLFGGSGT